MAASILDVMQSSPQLQRRVAASIPGMRASDFVTPRDLPNVLDQLNRDFAGGRIYWPRNDGQHCNAPVQVFDVPCTPAARARYLIRYDLWTVAQVALTAMLARVPPHTVPWRERATWAREVFQWVGVAVQAANITPRFLGVTDDETAPLRRATMCNAEQLASQGTCPVRDPQNPIPELVSRLTTRRAAAINAQLGLTGAAAVNPYYGTVWPAGYGEHRAQGAGARNILERTDDLIPYPRKREVISNGVLAWLDPNARRSLAAAKDAWSRFDRLGPSLRWDAVFKAYEGSDAVADHGLFAVGLEIDRAKEAVVTMTAQSYVADAGAWARWVTETPLELLVGRAAAFYLANYLPYFAARGELDVAPEDLMRQYNAAFKSGIASIADVGRGVVGGVADALPVVSLVAGVFKLLVQLLPFRRSTTCPSSLFLRTLPMCDVESAASLAEVASPPPPPLDRVVPGVSNVKLVAGATGIALGALLSKLVR